MPLFGLKALRIQPIRNAPRFVSWLAILLGTPVLTICKSKGESPHLIDSSIKRSSHPRAAAAAERVLPELLKDLEKIRHTPGDAVFVRAFKQERQLELFLENAESGKYDLFRTYRIAAASGALGPKLREGDRQVPEGFYFVGPKAMNPDSLYHLSFNIGYPNEFDRLLGRTGSAIMIHGNQVSAGCLAMTDEKIEEIFTLCDLALRNGQPFFRVHVFPFRMTEEKMATRKDAPHLPFWRNLQEGYEYFEANQIPPDVTVEAGRYRFQAPH